MAVSSRGKRRAGWLWSLLLIVGGLFNGCDSGGGGLDPVGYGPAPTAPGQHAPNPTLTVHLQAAGAGVDGLSSLAVIVYNVRGAQLARSAVPPGQSASFEDLPAGPVQLRVVGRDVNDGVLGFSDLSAAVPGDTNVNAPRLILTDQVPPRATPGAPFLAFTRLPASFQAGVPYRIEIGAFDAQGQLDTTASGAPSLTSSGVSAVMPEIGVLFADGRAAFPSLSFPPGSNGVVTFTASAGGFQHASSPTLPVRSN